MNPARNLPALQTILPIRPPEPKNPSPGSKVLEKPDYEKNGLINQTRPNKRIKSR